MNDAMTIGRKRPSAFALAAVFLAVASAATLAALTTTASADPRDKWCKGVHLRFFVGGAEGDAFGTIVYNGPSRPSATSARPSTTCSPAGTSRR